MVVGMTAVLSLAIARAYEQGTQFDQVLRRGRSEALSIQQFQDRIDVLLREAYLSPDAASDARISSAERAPAHRQTLTKPARLDL